MKKTLTLSTAIIPATAKTTRFLCEPACSRWVVETGTSEIYFKYVHSYHPYLIKSVYDNHGGFQETRYFTFKGKLDEIRRRTDF